MATLFKATGTPGIYRERTTGDLYLVFKHAGRRHTRRAISDDIPGARAELIQWRAEVVSRPAVREVAGAERSSWKGSVDYWLARQQARPDLSADTSRYYEFCCTRVRLLAPDSTQARDISARMVETWWAETAAACSANMANVCLSIVRRILADHRARGWRRDNPAAELGKMPVGQRRLVLPSPEQFAAIVAEIARQRVRHAREVSRLVRFLAFSGLRISEAQAITWEDVQPGKDGGPASLVVRSAKSRAKSAKFRVVPVVPALDALLSEMRAEWTAKKQVPSGPVWHVASPCRALGNACRRLKLPHLRVHDLRHLFATTCIESGVDIPTVSRWLGHSDGGALAMRTYGHLRDSHSMQAAARVKF